MKDNVPIRKHSRTRTRGVYEAPINSLIETHYSATGTILSYPFTGQIRDSNTEFAMMIDTVCTPFRTAMARGDVLFNGLYQQYNSIHGGSVGGEVQVIEAGPNYGRRYSCTGHWLAYLLRSASVPSRIDALGQVLPVQKLDATDIQRAVAEAQTKAATLPPDSQLLVALAELRSTVKLLPDILTGFAKMLRGLNHRYSNWTNQRRASVANLKDEYEFLRNLWLASRFGIRPLIGDAIGLTTALSRLRTGELVRVTSRGNASVNFGESFSGLLSYGVTRTPAEAAVIDSFSCRAMTLFAAKLGLLDDLGVNLANVPLAVVDLTSFSFVLNWMVNVNDFALALGTAIQPGWDPLGGCYVNRRESTTLYRTTGPTYVLDAYKAIYAPTRSLNGSITSVERIVQRYPVLPKPSLTVRSRPFKWLGDARLIDAVALFQQAMGGKAVKRLRSFGI